MTPQDQATPVGVQATSHLPPAPSTGSHALEPSPSEARRLPKANARPAPVLPLLRARWQWLLIATLLGTLFGLFLGARPTSAATAQLRILSVTDAFRLKQVGQTAASDASSLAVINRAAASPELAGQRGSRTENAYAIDLRNRVVATWPADTDIVTITVSNSNGQAAIAEANAVMKAVLDNNAALRTSQAKSVTDDINQMIKAGTVTDNGTASNDPESERQIRLAQGLGEAQLNQILQATAVTQGQVATVAVAGTSPLTTAALGGAGGFLLGALVTLMAGAGGRRVRNPEELRALAPELNLKSTTQAGEIAGRLLESKESTLVVLALPATHAAASRLAAAVANHLRTHGASVTLVNAISTGSADTDSLPDEVWVLRRDIRQDVKSYFHTDVLVVACTAEPEAVGLISGQSDLTAVVVAKEARSTLRQIWDTVGAVETADPIVVLSS